MKILKTIPERRYGEVALAEIEEGKEAGQYWVCYRHPDGQFVTLREATSDDLLCFGYIMGPATGD